MAKQTPKKNIIPKVSNAKIRPVTKKRPESNQPAAGIFTLLEMFFNKHQRIIIGIILALAGLFSFLSFDNKISTANDDALYIESGYLYAKNFFSYYYTETAPLYPIVLSLFIKLFGVKLFLLKSTSIFFFVLALFILYRAFRNRIPYILLFPSLLLTAINFQYLVYASLTYTETFSLMVFSIALLIFFKMFDKMDDAGYSFKNHIPHLILMGLICLIMMISRNVALAALGVIIVFFIYRKKYIESGIVVAGFAFFYFLYQMALRFIWHLDRSQFTSQGGKMFNKDAYNPQMGKETFSGLIVRFWENCQIYISSRFYYVLGFREEMSANNILLTLFSIGIIAWSLWLMHKKKQYTLIFTTLFYTGLLAATFISLHTSWGQTRLIMLYLPFILFNVFYLVHYYGQEISMTQILYPFLFFILFFVSISATFKQIGEKYPVFKENISGDPTYGYTPDWQNYIKMSKWCGVNLPAETKSIAVRKAPMSFIFSEGKEFYPIYNVPSQDADSLLIPFRQSNVNYIMLAELRLNPDMYMENQFINTIHRYAYYIQQKYQGAFTLVHQEGDLEKAQLYKINYNYIDSVKALQKAPQ